MAGVIHDLLLTFLWAFLIVATLLVMYYGPQILFDHWHPLRSLIILAAIEAAGITALLFLLSTAFTYPLEYLR